MRAGRTPSTAVQNELDAVRGRTVRDDVDGDGVAWRRAAGDMPRWQRRQWMSVFLVDVVCTAVAVDATKTVAEALVLVADARRATGVSVTPHRRQLCLLSRRSATFASQRFAARPTRSLFARYGRTLEQHSKDCQQ